MLGGMRPDMELGMSVNARWDETRHGAAAGHES